jgi:hypothetical protein
LTPAAHALNSSADPRTTRRSVRRLK